MLNEEQLKLAEEMAEKARIYSWNLVKDTEYSREKYDEYIKGIELKGLFTEYTAEDSYMNENHLLVGYASYGREFLEKVIDLDKASALNMFEVVTQSYLDLIEEVKTFTFKMEEMQNSLKEGEK